MWLNAFMPYCRNRFFNLIKAVLPFVVAVFVIVTFHFTNNIYIKCYPAIINLIFFLIFFFSLFKNETVIQKIARAMKPDIKPLALKYTRRLTYVWSTFLFVNFCIAFYSIYGSHDFWMLYNGFLSYFICGMIFVVEYCIRIWFKRKYDC